MAPVAQINGYTVYHFGDKHKQSMKREIASTSVVSVQRLGRCLLVYEFLHTSKETRAVRVRVRRPRMEECVVSLLSTFPRRLYGLYLSPALLQAGPGLASNRPLSSEATLVANLTMLGHTTVGWRDNGKVVRSRLSQVAQLRSLFCSDRLDGR